MDSMRAISPDCTSIHASLTAYHPLRITTPLTAHALVGRILSPPSIFWQGALIWVTN